METYKRVAITPEIERAQKEMMAVSDNDATAFLIDVFTDTCSGGGEGEGVEEVVGATWP